MITFSDFEAKRNYYQNSYHVVFYIYKSIPKMPRKVTVEFVKENCKYIENTNRACFAQVKSLMQVFYSKHKVIANRLLFKANFKRPDKSRRLSSDIISKWVSLCKRNGLMPKYVGRHFVKTGDFDVKVLNLDPNTLYMYLTAARFIQENPVLVEATVYFCSKGMGFFPAFSLASSMFNTNTGHSILVGSQVGYTPNKGTSWLDKHRQDLNEVLGLKRFIERGPDKSKLIKKIITSGKNFTVPTTRDFTSSFYNIQYEIGKMSLPGIEEITSVKPAKMDSKKILKYFK
jgi:hypothetical protein